MHRMATVNTKSNNQFFREIDDQNTHLTQLLDPSDLIWCCRRCFKINIVWNSHTHAQPVKVLRRKMQHSGLNDSHQWHRSTPNAGTKPHLHHHSKAVSINCKLLSGPNLSYWQGQGPRRLMLDAPGYNPTHEGHSKILSLSDEYDKGDLLLQGHTICVSQALCEAQIVWLSTPLTEP